MNIIFEGKETYEEIIERANKTDARIDFGEGSFVARGDNFDVMAAMLPQYKGKIDLVYIDPPFNTDQIFSIAEGRANTVSRSNRGKVVYSDAMTKDAFLKFMFDRFVLIRELLSDKGSLYVHIDIKMGHYFKVMLDEIFGDACFRNDITRIKSNPKNFERKAFGNQKDVILFYSKTKTNIWNNIKTAYNTKDLMKQFNKIDENGRRYTTVPLHAPGETSASSPTGKPWRGMNPPQGRHWRTDPGEFDRLDSIGRIEWSATGNPRIKKYADEHQGKKIQDIWEYKDPQKPVYPTEKNMDMLELIVKQSSEEGSFVMDCFAGSGATLLAACKNNRRFIGIDKSMVSVETIKCRMQNTNFDFLDLAEDEG